MSYLILENWPLLFICIAMVAAAVVDGWKLKVPNWLTFPLVISGWLFGLCHNLGWLPGTGFGGIGGSLIGTAVGCALLLPIYAMGYMGAGDVKMQMGFGAWVGAFFGVRDGMIIIIWAFCWGAIIGGIIALIMIAVRGDFRTNLQNVKEVFRDWASGGGIGAVSDKAAKRKPRMQLLPYGIPLCLGFIAYLVFSPVPEDALYRAQHAQAAQQQSQAEPALSPEKGASE